MGIKFGLPEGRTQVESENDKLLGYSAEQSRMCRSTFQRSILPTLSGRFYYGGSTRLPNVGLHLRDYTALYPRRLLSSYPPP
jgi:hypothetical protein